MNSGNFGLSFNQFAFGQEGLAQAGIFFVSMSIATYSVGIFIASMGKASPRQALVNLLKVPAIYAVLLAVVFLRTGWQLPLPFQRTTQLLGDAAIPAMLVLLGMQLSAIRWDGQIRPLLLANSLRLLISPLVALGLVLVLGLAGIARQVGVLEASMPSAVLTIVLATEYDVEPAFVAAASSTFLNVCAASLIWSSTASISTMSLQSIFLPSERSVTDALRFIILKASREARPRSPLPLSIIVLRSGLLEALPARVPFAAALVCAARSCPPLRREAYVADQLDAQLDANVREWLANPALNHFYPDRRLVIVSPIFKWYGKDFDSYPGGLEGFLLMFGPPAATGKLKDGKFTIRFATYHWGLNDQAGRGEEYSSFQLGTNWLKNWFRNWFVSLGRKYNVNPFIFGGIYVGAIPFFTLCVAWIISNLRRKKSIVLPVLAASFFFISAYLYLLIVGRNIPAWVYAVIVGMIGLGLYSTIRKIRAKAGLGGKG